MTTIDATPTENYAETAIVGSKYKRVCQVNISNPLDGTASITMQEQEVYVLADKNIYQPCGTLYKTFDKNSELDMAIYQKLNELYVLLRTARDNKNA